MIVASNLTKFYGTKPAICDLSFEIGEGEIVGFLGLNGAGKSTTLRIISCQLVPTSGTVTVSGRNVIESSEEIRKRIGYLPEIPPLYAEMTVRSYLDFVARLKGVATADAARRVEEVMEITRLTAVSNQVIGTLSAGYRQRVGIAQAVVHGPDLLILDEPFQGLDPVQTVEMREMIRGLGGDHTVLLSSHLLSQIHETCDRILVIQQGQIVAQGRESELVSLLSGGMIIEVEVRGPVEDVGRAVESIKGFSDFVVHPLEEDIVRLQVQVPAGRETWERTRSDDDGETVTYHDAREALSAALVEAHLGLREIKRSADELESVFVQLTQNDAPTRQSKSSQRTSSTFDEKEVTE